MIAPGMSVQLAVTQCATLCAMGGLCGCANTGEMHSEQTCATCTLDLASEEGTREYTMQEIDSLRKQATEPQYAAEVRAQTVQRLRQIYAGQISTSAARTSIHEHSARMNSLMAQWNPLRADVDLLLSLAGEPSRREDDRLIYEFDTGLGGLVWTFEVRRDTIVGVTFGSLE